MQLRGVQGLLQAHDQEGAGLRLQGREEVPHRQASEESLSVLQIHQVHSPGNEERRSVPFTLFLLFGNIPSLIENLLINTFGFCELGIS